MGSNDSYAQIRAQVLMMDPLLLINRVNSLVLVEERQRNIGNGSTFSRDEPMSFCYDSSSSISFVNLSGHKSCRDKLVCTHCGYNGHTKDKCYNLNGYLRSWM